MSGTDQSIYSNNSEFSGNGAQGDSIAAITSGIESIQFGLERDLSQQIRRERRETLTRNQTDEASIAAIVFSDSRSTKQSDDSRKAKSQNKSLEVTNSMFYRPGDDDDSTDDSNVEEIPRSEVGEGSDPDMSIQEDAVLFIKMTPYPLTLEEFIVSKFLIKTLQAQTDPGILQWPDLQTGDKSSRISHCFHALPAVHILLAILEGVEYLHNKQIVHRDLKPKNIFLSILDPTEKPTQGYINIYKCADCGHGKSTKPTFICPRIGDFGLIHELKYVDSDSFSASDDIPFPFASSNVGTALYCPPHSLKDKAIVCPKLDVFSLGIMAFELVYHFGTDTERRMVLTKLGKTGEFPDDFKNHEMREGIEKMVCKDRSQRWNTNLVREWLEELKQKWE
jgi:translation initiation factor 2-alpha kinase 3